MVNKYFFIAAFLFWLLPAIVRLCVIDISEIAISHTTTFEINSPTNKTLYFLYNKDKHSAFITILKNNMQGCILNVLGGGLLGIGTLFNLLLNGFCFADVCCRTYKLGMSIRSAWNEEEQQWYFSILDVVQVLTDNAMLSNIQSECVQEMKC